MNINTIENIDCMIGLKEMPDNSVDFTLTDIPYDEVSRDSHGIQRNFDKGSADIMTFDLTEFLNEIYRVSKNSCCIFCGRKQFSEIYSFFDEKEGAARPIVWEKTNPFPINGKYIYLSGVEFAVWFKKIGTKVFNANCKNTVFRYAKGKTNIHPTQKNVGLFKELILDNTNKGDIVLDPCMGSGTTAVAALETGRNYYGFEIDSGYYSKILERLNGCSVSIKKEDEEKSIQKTQLW